MKKNILMIFAAALITVLGGCSAAGSFQTNQVTSVELSEPNFNIIAHGVQGSADQGYLLGIAFSQGADVGTFALARVSGDEKLYDTAVKDLWKNFKEKYGDTEGRKLALVNIRQDADMLNTIIYAEVKFYITADVVEFIEAD